MKFACLAAAAVAALIAMPAAASDLRVSRTPSPVVRISIAGKTDAQVANEIQAAAVTVCGAPGGPCAQTATREANRQYAAIKRSRSSAETKVEVVREDHASVRVKLAGRSPAQIEADIDAAAKTVCKAVRASDFRGCVDKATRAAKTQLREMAVAPGAERLASR